MIAQQKGHDALWGWFGLSYAAFLTLPRVLLHEMPDEWQQKMADLLSELDEAFPNTPDVGFSVRATRHGKLVKMPDGFLYYRHPDYEAIDRMRVRS